MIPAPSAAIRQARKILQLNQQEFAERFGKTQSVLSRYESGSVHAPSDIVMHCMHIINEESISTNSDDMEEIILKIRNLGGDQHIKLREALNIFLDKLLSTK